MDYAITGSRICDDIYTKPSSKQIFITTIFQSPETGSDLLYWLHEKWFSHLDSIETNWKYAKQFFLCCCCGCCCCLAFSKQNLIDDGLRWDNCIYAREEKHLFFFRFLDWIGTKICLRILFLELTFFFASINFRFPINMTFLL